MKKTEIYDYPSEMNDVIDKSSVNLQSKDADFRKRSSRSFIAIWILSSFGPLCIIIRYNKYFVSYYENILVHIVHMQMTQIALILMVIENRMNIIIEEFSSQKNSNMNFETMQKKLLKLYDIHQSVLRHFRLPLALNLLQIYSSYVGHLYWIGIVLFGLDDTNIGGKVFT